MADVRAAGPLVRKGMLGSVTKLNERPSVGDRWFSGSVFYWFQKQRMCQTEGLHNPVQHASPTCYKIHVTRRQSMCQDDVMFGLLLHARMMCLFGSLLHNVYDPL